LIGTADDEFVALVPLVALLEFEAFAYAEEALVAADMFTLAVEIPYESGFSLLVLLPAPSGGK
jgi:hypothetical protein